MNLDPAPISVTDQAYLLRKYTKSLYTKLGRSLVLCIGSNSGLKFGWERSFGALSPRFADPKIRNETNNYKFLPHFDILISIS